MSFDEFAHDYSALLRDPIRDSFSSTALFFHERKRDLIRGWFGRRHVNTRELRYLDVGCGKGELLTLLRSDFKFIAGCDPSGQMLASLNCGNIKRQADATEVPFDDDEFDFITAVCVYHHVLPALRSALTQDIVRTLKPGGLACIIEHNPYNPATRLIVNRTPVDADAVLLPMRETAELMATAGLHVAGYEYFLYFPEFIYRMLGRFETQLRAIPMGGQYAVFAYKPA
jgi:SAM-dependent methyltransferase